MMERAEFPVQRNKTLYGFFLAMSLLRTLLPPMLTFSNWGTAAHRIAYRRLDIADLWMAIAAVGNEKGNQRSDAFDIGAIDY
jgi:hypothetical protein